MKREPQTIGEVAQLIDAGMEHADQAWSLLLHDLGIDHTPADSHLDGFPFEPGSVGYHLAAFHWHIIQSLRGIHRGLGVITEGQLCPYQDCCWSCGFDQESWYRCPNCLRVFFTESTNSDIEDWHSFPKQAFSHRNAPSRPIDIALAWDLGPSWGTPEGNPAKRG